MIDTSLNSSNFYFLLAVAQGLVLAVLILYKRPRHKAKQLFGLLVLFFSITLLHIVLEESISAFNSKFPVPMEFSFCFGPLVYLHILLIKNPQRGLRRKDLLHFLPSLLLDVLLFTSFFVYIRFHMDWAYDHLENIIATALGVSSLALIQLSIYAFVTFRELKNVKLALKEYGTVQKWVSRLLIAWLVMIGFLLIAVPVALLNLERMDDNSHLIYKPLGAIMVIFIYGLGYLFLAKYMAPVSNYIDRVKKFPFKAQELEQKKEQLLTALEQQALYKDPKLSLAGLAGALQWPVNDLSVMINEVLKVNFNDLINGYRIEAFKVLAQSPEGKKYSITGLGQEVGFQSKASFYRAFKKETGKTPTDYLAEKQP